MTTAKLVEHRVIRQVLEGRCAHPAEAADGSGTHGWPQRLIAVLAVTVGLAVAASFLQELFWALLAAATAGALALD